MSKILRIMGLIILIVGICLLSGCNKETGNIWKNQNTQEGGNINSMDMANVEYTYSREYTNDKVSSVGFGSGRSDVEYVVLDYIYKSKELKEKYGDSFEVKEVGGRSGGKTFFFLWLYKGDGRYFVDIDEDEWIVKISKDYFGKWKVTDCYLNVE